jgi:hypothetical protein
MEMYRRDFFVSRIQAGYLRLKIDDCIIYIKQPSIEVEYESNEVFLESIEEGEKEGLYTDEELYSVLVDLDLWSDLKEKELTDITPKHIEYWQEELFNSRFSLSKQETIRKYLAQAKSYLNELYEQRHCYDYLTIDGYANFAKNLFIIDKTAEYLNGDKVDWSGVNVNTILNHVYQNTITAEEIRELARTSPWATIWATRKKNNKIFDNTRMTSEQQALVSWSMMYDNIRESPECPPDDVIDDDDMLDGWLIIQRKKREKERNERGVDQQLSDKVKGAGEIGIIVRNQEELDKVNQLNDVEGQVRKAGRLKQIKTEGNVQEQNLHDVRRDLQMQLTNARRKE